MSKADSFRRFVQDQARTASSRQEDRDRIARQTQEYLDRGGVIEQAAIRVDSKPRGFLGDGMNATKSANSRGGRA